MESETKSHSAILLFAILLAGAMGAIVAFYVIGDLDIAIGEPAYLNASPTMQLVIRAAAGGIAAVIFIFILANSDRKDQMRLFAIALLSGMFWQPVWESGRMFVVRAGDASTANQAEDKIAEVQDMLDANGNARSADIGAAIKEIDELMSQLRSPDLQDRLDEDLLALRNSATGSAAKLLDQSLSENLLPQTALRLWGPEIFEQAQPPANGGAVINPGALGISPSFNLEGIQRVAPGGN